MAIQINLETSQYGTSFSGAYFRLVTATVSRMREGHPKFVVNLDVAGYATANPTDDTREIEFRRYYATLEEVEAQQGSTFVNKCYAWLMSQPDMQGSLAV